MPHIAIPERRWQSVMHRASMAAAGRRVHGHGGARAGKAGRLLAAALLALLVCVMQATASWAQAAPPAQPATQQATQPAARPGANAPLQVLTKPIAPFVMVDEEGRARGFSIALWEALARRMRRPYRLKVAPNLKALLDGVRSGKADVAIAAITITAARERQMDFSHPYFQSGLQVMVRNDAGRGGLLAQMRGVVAGLFSSRGFRLALWTLLFIVLVGAHLIWLLERGRNEHFARSYPKGLWDGAYWALVTVSTVGYGDKVPRTQGGRVLATILIIFGYLAYAWFTASMAASLTVSRLEGDINGPDDLRGHAVATVAHSTSARWLRQRPGVRLRLVPRIEEAYRLLEEGVVDAVVYDFPALRHHVAQGDGARFKVVGPVFQREPYGIALPQGSRLREALNSALLEMQESGEYQRIYRQWFGASP